MFWLVFRLIPVRLVSVAALVLLGTHMLGLDLVTPLLDWFTATLVDQTWSSFVDSWTLW